MIQDISPCRPDNAYRETVPVPDDCFFPSGQPWGFSDSVIAGYTARLDGSDKICLDRKELAAAKWLCVLIVISCNLWEFRAMGFDRILHNPI